MSRGVLLTGTAGGIIGSIAGGFGIVWGILNIFYVWQLYFYSLELLYYSFFGGILSLAIIPEPLSFLWFFASSILLSILLIVSGILLGVGFYGLYQAGGGAMGIVGLIFGIIGGAAGGLFILLGILIPSNTFITFITPISPLIYPWLIQVPYAIPIPSFLYIWIGLIILAITFIIIAVASFAVRYVTNRPSSSVAAGILSIVGACFFFPYILVTPNPLQGGSENISFLGGIFGLVGFTLIFVAFILWAVVFYSSREI